MDPPKGERLEEVGFRVGTVADLLGLMSAEDEVVEIRVTPNAADVMRDEPTVVIVDRPSPSEYKECPQSVQLIGRKGLGTPEHDFDKPQQGLQEKILSGKGM